MGRGIRIHKMEITIAVLRHHLDCKWLCVVIEMKLVVSFGREEQGLSGATEMFSLDWSGGPHRCSY